MPSVGYDSLSGLPTTNNSSPVTKDRVLIKSSLWKSREFYFYYSALIFGIFQITRAALRISSSENSNYDKFYYKIRPGWMFGRLIDVSDHQYRAFRNLLPLAIVAFVSYVLVHRIIIFCLRNKPLTVQLNARAVVTILGLFILHGFSILKILTIVMINFLIGKKFGRSLLNPMLTWLLTFTTMYLMERRVWLWSNIWSPLDFLDRFGGLYERWHVTFNITLLRLISFNMDFYYAMRSDAKDQVQRHQHSCKLCENVEDCEKIRSLMSPPSENFNISAYFSYIFYLPLFIAGPIVSFNNFISQIGRPTPQIRPKYIVIYAARLLGSFLVLEGLLHFIYANAIKEAKAWTGFTPIEFCALGLFNLFIVWLKLLFIWRFFRLIALMDGIDPPENMIRCIANNYGGLGFWRGWHRSFNLWIIRYMYIPMGGSRMAALSIWPIFTFVALWHDFKARMVMWAWFMCVSLIPEIAVPILSQRLGLPSHRLYRHMAAAAASFSLLQLILCNLIGFGLGIDGTRELVSRVLTPSNAHFILLMMGYFFIICQLAFEVREEEIRRGIFRNF